MAWLMIAPALIGVVLCLASGRGVPWQGRQAVIVMAAAMVAMGLAGRDPRVSLLVGALLLASAMVGTVGVRGAAGAPSCCHRALGCLVMAVCAFAGLAGSEISDPTGHGSHLGADAVAALGAIGICALIVWTIVNGIRRHAPARARRRMLAEEWVMTAGVLIMWSLH